DRPESSHRISFTIDRAHPRLREVLIINCKLTSFENLHLDQWFSTCGTPQHQFPKLTFESVVSSMPRSTDYGEPSKVDTATPQSRYFYPKPYIWIHHPHISLHHKE
ncbi:hypothetical protein STEG23_008344, partial [Scotinomys teguina]